MDACNLLLGRPWQFDREVTHDGRKNTYTFKISKKTITLAPLPPTQAIAQTPNWNPTKAPNPKTLHLDSILALLMTEPNQEKKMEFHPRV